MMKFIKNNTTSIFVIGFITLAFLTIYATVQQSIRQAANDPQIQAAEEVSNDLIQGAQPQQIVSNTSPMDMSKDLAPFITIFNSSDQQVISSAQLNGVTPVPPAGTFVYAKQHGEDRFTWQTGGVREAAVMVYSSSSQPYFVLVARSLKEVENRENGMLAIVEIAWLISMVGYIGLILTNRHLLKEIS